MTHYNLTDSYHFEPNDTPETKMTVLLCWIDDLRSEVSRLTKRVAELETLTRRGAKEEENDN